MNHPFVYAIALCAAAAALEGVFAGRGVRQRLAELSLPRYSPPLSVWFVIGGLFYAMCFTVLYRLFRLPASRSRDLALALILGMMLMNALWNFAFFRMRAPFLSFVAFLPYALLAVMLLVLTLTLDRIAAWALLPYVLYLVYALAWGYGVWQRNPN